MAAKIPLDSELSYLSHLTGKPLEMRIFPMDDKGDEKTVAAIHAINLFKMAETTMPESGATYVTPTGISEVEYKFFVRLFDEFMNLKKDWVDGRLFAYSLMKVPRIRKESEGMQKLYAGFRDFLGDLSKGTKILIMNSLDPQQACSKLEKMVKNERALESAYNYIQKNKDQEWNILQTVDDCWGMVFPEQYSEAMSAKPQIYLPKIQRTELAVKFVKGMVHQVLEDGRIDEVEKEIVRNLLLKRFEGFEDVSQHCIDQMYHDISVKDVLFNFALNGKLNGINVPPTIKQLSHEIIFKIPEKVERAKNLLREFEGKKIDSETLHLAAYALQNIIGIRGVSNCKLALSDHDVSREELEKIGLHDMPAIKKLNENPVYSRNCEFWEIKALATENPDMF